MNAALRDYLLRRHGLAGACLPAVDLLLEAWEKGHTALAVGPELRAELAASPAVHVEGRDSGPRPLVLTRGGLLQSWRLRRAELRIRARLGALAAAPPEPRGPDVEAALRATYPDPEDAQRRAVEVGLDRRLALVTGGPGTGKTHTAARLLALARLRTPGLRSALAAPTGKAAQRLGESVAAAADRLPEALAGQAGALKADAREARTLHRLLGWGRAGSGGVGREPGMLPHDLVLVDESSMMDVALWDALLRALGPDARLVVLGDPRQLESVEPGRVLGALVEEADRDPDLGSCHVELTENRRFAGRRGIGAAAAAVLAHDPAALNAAAGPDFELLPPARLDEALEGLWPWVRDLAGAGDPQAALGLVDRARVLCALNEGPWGVGGINRRIRQRLRDVGGGTAEPVLVTANDPATGLFNGDLGVRLPGGAVAFRRDGGPRVLGAASLPEHAPAWAMTVHRAQGSEVASVLLVLPPGGHALAGPELLYTALTRARERVVLCADDAALARACAAREPRVTGLGEAGAP